MEGAFDSLRRVAVLPSFGPIQRPKGRKPMRKPFTLLTLGALALALALPALAYKGDRFKGSDDGPFTITPIAPGVTTASKPSLSISGAASAEEGGSAVFTVRLSKPSKKSVSVRFATSDGSATAGADYARASGTLRFKPRETTKPVTVVVMDDADTEDPETFTVLLSRPLNARLARESGRATIAASDLPAAFTAVVSMDGSQGIGGGHPSATGSATLSFDPAAGTVTYTISAQGMGEPSFQTHLHRGGPSVDGPILVALAGPADNRSSTATTGFSRPLMPEVSATPNDFYVQIHTTRYFSGAMRGQLRITP